MTILRNFDALDEVSVSTSTPIVTETVTIKRPEQRQAFLAKDVADWRWHDLRDYVVGEIEKRHGVQPRDPKKEYGIFNGFVGRWGIEQAVAIARYAFDFKDGMWLGEPILVTRFTKGSDPYFARTIAANLATLPAAPMADFT